MDREEKPQHKLVVFTASRDKEGHIHNDDTWIECDAYIILAKREDGWHGVANNPDKAEIPQKMMDLLKEVTGA